MSRLNVISKFEELASIASVWHKLFAQNHSNRIFQSYEWCCCAWECVLSTQSGNELCVLVWKQDGNDDVVIFPFYLDGKGALRFIMDEHSDYCDCVYLPGRNHHLAFKDALEYIKTDNRVKQIALHKMDANSEALNYFAALAPKASVVKENTYSWIEIFPSEDFAASQSQLRSKDKANVRAIRRKAERFCMHVYSRSNGECYPEAEINLILEEMYRRGIRNEGFMPDSMKAFCRNIYEEELSDIIALSDEGGHAVAMNYILKMDGRRLSWIFLYTDSHASTELYVKYFYGHEMDRPIIFDFGSGGYEYKFGTFRPCTRALLGLTVILDRKLALRFTLKCIIRGIKDLLKQVLRRD